MTEQELQIVFSRNLAAARKAAGHTQSDLASLINYSDKSISKWERGDGMPDVFVLYRLAKIYHLTPNDLLGEKPINALPKERKLLIWMLSVGLCWLLAAVVYFVLYLSRAPVNRIWLAFLYAVPASAIVSVVFASLWGNRLHQLSAVSLLIWSLAVIIHLTALIPGVTLIYMVAGIVQLLFCLWYWLLSKTKKY